MVSDVLPETQDHPHSRIDDLQDSPARHGFPYPYALLAIGVVVVAVSAAVMFSTIGSSSETDAGMTHTITRGDLLVTVIEQGTLESSDNTEIKCKVRGQNTVIWVVESGTVVKPGDDLVRLDTLFMEEQINERTKYALWSRSGAESWKANMARAELAIPEYLEGRYVASLMTLEKDLAITESRLRTALNILAHATMMAERGYISELEIERKKFWVTEAELSVEVNRTNIDVLKRFTKFEEMERLNGELKVAQAQYKANAERAFADAHRRDRALEEFEFCVVKAERGGMVIHPSAARWKNAPEIEEGATVHKDQVLLLMPDLSKMQVKVGIHESIIDRIKPGQPARVTLPDKTLDAEVSSVASVTRPAGWWTGNVVKYDTIIQLPSVTGLKPGMSAEVEVIIARYHDVLTIPVAAVVETAEGFCCWVTAGPSAPERRSLQLGDSNDVFIIVEVGLEAGDEVVLNPLAFIEEAQTEVMQTLDESKAGEPGSDKQADGSNRPKAARPRAESESR